MGARPVAWGVTNGRWLGRLFIRIIAMGFDDTLAPGGERRHSKPI